MDSGKKKIGESGSSTQHMDSGSNDVNVDPVTPNMQDFTEPTIPDPELEQESLKRKEVPEGDAENVRVLDAQVLKKVSMSSEAVGPNPRNMKEWLASLPPEERRMEHFENYAFVQELHQFRKESFGELVDRLMDEVTLVSGFQLSCILYLVHF